jgi:NAD(P)-dependent dehydrogenase (short-subunit alcohol dehydrogenase family)
MEENKSITIKNVALFGGTGGLGSSLGKELSKKYNVFPLGTKDVDISNIEQVQAFFDNNEIDIVLNFSGINYDCFMHKYDAEKLNKAEELINVNINGTNNILTSCLPKLRERGYGRIILISSVLAEMPIISTGVYAGCKGYLDSIAKTVALENAAKGITCNTLQLGYFDGGLTYKIPEEFRNKLVKTIPMKRFGSIQELYKVIDTLIEVEYITGTNIKINGGVYF